MKADKLNEIKSFFEKNRVLPCFLKVDSEGVFSPYTGGFEEIPIEKLHFLEEKRFSNEEFSSELSFENGSTLNINSFLDVSLFHSDAVFEETMKKMLKSFSKQKYFVGKYILYSISIDPDDVHFTNHISQEISQLAEDNNKNPDDKAKELDSIIKSYGFYIPLKIYIGGMFSMKKSDSSTNSKGIFKSFFSWFQKTPAVEVENKLNATNTNYLNEIFKSRSINIKGGDISARTYDDWEKTINISNSFIIGYENLKNFHELIKYNIRNKLSSSLKIIDEKYEERKQFFQIIENLKDNKEFVEKGNASIKVGICDEKKIPKIIHQKFDAQGDFISFSRRYDQINQSFSDIIVGYYINCCWADGTNGAWFIKENPLLKTRIDISFTSQFFRGQRFELFVYLMKFPS